MRTIDQDVGARIKALREQRGMSQAALGERIDLNQSTVSRIEEGSRPLTASELAALSSTLGVTIGAIVGEAAEVPTLLRAGDSDNDSMRESLRIFSECIDEYRGVEVLDAR